MEYAKYFEKDPAMTRRFQPITIDEPSVERACYMLRGILAPMEAHHGVRISDEAVVAAVSLSARYIPSRQLPDKAVSLLDTACARVAISQSTIPAKVADLKVKIGALASEIAAKEAQRDLGEVNEDRLKEAKAEQAEAETALAATETMYSSEKTMVDEILSLRGNLAAEGADMAALREQLHSKMQGLEATSPDDRMVYAHVDEESVLWHNSSPSK